MITNMHYTFLSFVALVSIQWTVCEVTSSWRSSKSWRSNVEVYDDISLALGDRHVRDHFPSSLLLTEAIHHQLEILHQRALGTASDVDKKDSRYVFKVQHPFLSCTKYLEYNSTLTSFRDFFGHSFQPHVTLTSAAADKVCFISFVEDSTALDFYLSATSLVIHLPVPDVLKFDHSILHAIDWTIDQQHNSGKNLRTGELSKKFKHPILKDVTRGSPVELSFTYRSSWSSQSQEHSTNQIMEKLRMRSSKNVEGDISSRTEHWDNFVWGTARSFPDVGSSQIRAQSRYPKRQMRAAELRRYQPWEISQYTSLFSRVANLPPLQSTVDSSNAVENGYVSDDLKLLSIREKWSSMGDDYAKLLGKKSKALYETEHCNYADITVQHREKNVILKLGTDFFSSADSAGACFSNLVVLLSSDPGITRIALSKPMSTLNKSARPITQTGTLSSEVYSDAGLDGTGVVVGISDTGIDEESCFFKDPKGAVRRSNALNPFTDPSYRKVIQYVNYSGGGGDVFAGHGSHVAGSVAGNNPGDASYRGMAPMAKLAFFDIMAFKAEEGDLSVPSDLSKYIFNSSYKAGARYVMTMIAFNLMHSFIFLYVSAPLPPTARISLCPCLTVSLPVSMLICLPTCLFVSLPLRIYSSSLVCIYGSFISYILHSSNTNHIYINLLEFTATRGAAGIGMTPTVWKWISSSLTTMTSSFSSLRGTTGCLGKEHFSVQG
jgi:Subtilase family